MKPKKEFMLVRLHQTPEKPTRISKPLRSNILSDMSNQPSSRDLGIFIARNNPTDASGPAYFIAKIMPDGLVKRYTITRLFPSSQWHCFGHQKLDSNLIFIFFDAEMVVYKSVMK